MANQPRKRTGGPVRSGQPAVVGEMKQTPTVAEYIDQSLTAAALAPEPQYDTFQVLVDGGNYFLSGPVPTKPVRVDGALFTWWQTGGCPWAEVIEPLDTVLQLTNVTLMLAHTAILEDGGVLFEPAGHVWKPEAAWLQGSDGSETAVPRG